jgi:predicted TIM-barrel fold metal-dependent hydrolase
VEALLKLGCDGIKIMEAPDSRAHRGYGLNDSRFEAMFALLEKEQIPINIHCADPEEFWLEGGCYYGGNFISKEQHYKEVFEVLDRHPRLKVCFAHFFFLSNYPEEAERVMNKYPNVYFDLTPGTEMYYNFDKNIPFWQCFFKKYSHRILHGTDANTYKDFNPQLEALVYRKLTEKGEFTQNCYGKDFTVSGLALDNKTVENISFNNYFRFFGSEPKNVDEKFFYKCCEKVLNDITAEPTDEHYKRSFSLIPWLKDDPTQQRSMDFLKYALGNK